jgi:hypothetical protein
MKPKDLEVVVRSILATAPKTLAANRKISFFWWCSISFFWTFRTVVASGHCGATFVQTNGSILEARGKRSSKTISKSTNWFKCPKSYIVKISPLHEGSFVLSWVKFWYLEMQFMNRKNNEDSVGEEEQRKKRKQLELENSVQSQLTSEDQTSNLIICIEENEDSVFGTYPGRR